MSSQINSIINEGLQRIKRNYDNSNSRNQFPLRARFIARVLWKDKNKRTFYSYDMPTKGIQDEQEALSKLFQFLFRPEYDRKWKGFTIYACLDQAKYTGKNCDGVDRKRSWYDVPVYRIVLNRNDLPKINWKNPVVGFKQEGKNLVLDRQVLYAWATHNQGKKGQQFPLFDLHYHLNQ